MTIKRKSSTLSAAMTLDPEKKDSEKMISKRRMVKRSRENVPVPKKSYFVELDIAYHKGLREEELLTGNVPVPMVLC